MKEITIIEKLYDFDELSDSAKETAKREYSENFLSAEEYEYIVLEGLKNHFPHSKELKVQFSLSYMQGDGLNVYGKMELSDAIDYVLKRTTKFQDHIRFFNWLKTLDYYITLPYNQHYCYCTVWKYNYADDIVNCLEIDNYDSGLCDKLDILESFSKEFIFCMQDLCKEYENAGYDYFYDISDDEINEVMINNGYMFYENGTICWFCE